MAWSVRIGSPDHDDECEGKFYSGFNLRRNDAQRSATRESVASGSAVTGSYLAMNAAAT